MTARSLKKIGSIFSVFNPLFLDRYLIINYLSLNAENFINVSSFSTKQFLFNQNYSVTTIRNASWRKARKQNLLTEKQQKKKVLNSHAENKCNSRLVDVKKSKFDYQKSIPKENPKWKKSFVVQDGRNDDPERLDEIRRMKNTKKILPVIQFGSFTRVNTKPISEPQSYRKQTIVYYPIETKVVETKEISNLDPPQKDKIRYTQTPGISLTPIKFGSYEKPNKKPVDYPKPIEKPVHFYYPKETKVSTIAEDLADKEPPRLDLIRGFKFKLKPLPVMKFGNCRDCFLGLNTDEQPVKRPKKLFKAEQLKYTSKYGEDERCNFDDALSSVTYKRVKLPTIEIEAYDYFRTKNRNNQFVEKTKRKSRIQKKW